VTIFSTEVAVSVLPRYFVCLGGDVSGTIGHRIRHARTFVSGLETVHEATIAIAVRDGQAAAYAYAYVCDGRRVEAWLQGTIADGRPSTVAPYLSEHV
jgi:hypothetical protein